MALDEQTTPEVRAVTTGGAWDGATGDRGAWSDARGLEFVAVVGDGTIIGCDYNGHRPWWPPVFGRSQ